MNDGLFSAVSEQMADGMARICRLYGVTPLAGRLYAQLFLSTQPRGLEALCEAVGASKSSVSVALRKLESARVVRRLPPRRDRRDFYELVEDPWAVLADWSRLYFTPELEMLRETTSAVLGALDAPQADGEPLRARLENWRGFGEAIARVLNDVTRQAAKVAPARRIAVELES